MARALILLGAIWLTACSGGGGAPPTQTPQNLRPPNAPDIVLLSVSGRCTPTFLCNPPEENQPYLGLPGDAAEAIALAFQGAGYTVARGDYIAALASYDDNSDLVLDRFGFLALIADLQSIFNDWIDGFDNPTHIVIVAHSHGCVWAHIACSVLPTIPIDYLISLDANCLEWEPDYGQEVADYLAANGNPFSWNIAAPCDVWPIPGLIDPQDTEDVVFDNVAVNLEVRSAGIVSDYQINHRPNGNRADVYTYDALFDGHSDVHDPNGESMPWVLAQLATLGY